MRSLLLGLIVASTAVAEGKVALVADGLNEPFAFGFLGNDLLLTEFGANRVVRITPDGKVSVVAGNGKIGSSDGIGSAASMNAPHNLAIVGNHAYISDTQAHRLRLLEISTGKLSTLGGSVKGFSGDGNKISEARFDQLYHVSLTPDKKALLICDLGNRRIRSFDIQTQIVTTIAGNGKRGLPKNGGVASEEPLIDPRAVEADSKGRIWILERGGNALRVVENGKIRTVAGTGEAGYSGDDGPAIQAKLNGPKGLFIKPDGNVLIADAENHCIREYNPMSETIRRVAGTAKSGKGAIGKDVLDTDLKRPHAVAVDQNGTMYIADSYNGRLLKVEK